MSELLAEASIECPWCGERIDILIDTSAGDQTYIEDCQVCCQPIEIGFTVTGDEVASLRVAASS